MTDAAKSSRIDAFQQAILTSSTKAEPTSSDASSPAPHLDNNRSSTAHQAQPVPPSPNKTELALHQHQAAAAAPTDTGSSLAAAGTQEQGTWLVSASEGSVSTSADAVPAEDPGAAASAPQVPAASTAHSARAVGLVYDAYMELHIPPGGLYTTRHELPAAQPATARTLKDGAAEHQEQPGRTRAIWAALCTSGLAGRCKTLPSCQASVTWLFWLQAATSAADQHGHAGRHGGAAARAHP